MYSIGLWTEHDFESTILIEQPYYEIFRQDSLAQKKKATSTDNFNIQAVNTQKYFMLPSSASSIYKSYLELNVTQGFRRWNYQPQHQTAQHSSVMLLSAPFLRNRTIKGQYKHLTNGPVDYTLFSADLDGDGISDQLHFAECTSSVDYTISSLYLSSYSTQYPVLYTINSWD
ncbi:MAG: hypothetical protein GY810_19935 [Aureispira sp.]|nr:hypothetical protein [Aureispira sp.]